MKRSARFLVFFYMSLAIGLMTGCGSSGDSNPANQTPNATTEETLGKDIVGSWNANYDDNLCNYNTSFSFLDDGTFSLTDVKVCTDGDYDSSYNGIGTWEIIDGVLHTTFTESSDGSLGDLVIYTFITSSEHMAMAPDKWLYSRIGNGSGLADTWSVDISDCTNTFVFNPDRTWTSDSTCEDSDDEDHSSGTYATNEGGLTLLTSSGIMNLSYKLFGDSTLAICENTKLFTKNQ